MYNGPHVPRIWRVRGCGLSRPLIAIVVRPQSLRRFLFVTDCMQSACVFLGAIFPHLPKCNLFQTDPADLFEGICIKGPGFHLLGGFFFVFLGSSVFQLRALLLYYLPNFFWGGLTFNPSGSSYRYSVQC